MTVRKPLGFTLVEVITVVLIIGVLAAIAYPSYVGMMQRTRRAEAATILNEQQLRLEKHRVDNASYATYVPQGVFDTPFYAFDFVEAQSGPTTWRLTATPEGAHTNDDCGTLTLRFNAGAVIRENSGSGTDCW